MYINIQRAHTLVRIDFQTQAHGKIKFRCPLRIEGRVVDWILTVQDWIHCQALMNVEVRFVVPLRLRNYMTL
jgi:hypothetical protein